MKTKEINEDEMVSIIYDALEIREHNLECAPLYPEVKQRTNAQFAKDYVAHLYSTWRSKAEKNMEKVQ